ncbi:ABC transporter ATP-binding protein [Rhodococcus sp. B10]|uniref:ABC transporter ATP-binding protein n=1 Tax=Rhodococcus sp. B10 TaxID=2695876 RepID=UPI001430F707|nr:ABC transporter ATP-binding protein [Rhodococcus sp. B10]NIL78345.1 High-affinity branched-chain amino acid transport ATP-binding protein LivF [Rhodococcus sp. B10]
MLTVENLSVTYGPVAAVRGISFSCAEGEIVTIVGANGAGKSSALLAIAGGLRSGVSGTVTVNGAALLTLPPETRVARGLALVPERRRILASLTVRENLQVATASRKDKPAAHRDIRDLMDRFPILAARASGPAGLLSGGEQQQLAIARALIAKPSILLLDEPSLGLAPKVIDEIFALLDELRRDGIGVVLVEQNARRAAAIADRALLLRQGSITAEEDHDHVGALDAYFGLSPHTEES